MKFICYLSISLLLFVSCIGHEKDYLGDDIELWKDTEAWDFAKCISKGKFEKAEKILEENHLDVDIREPKYGESLLSWAIFNDNIDAVKFLIDHGANPNLHNTYNGESPMTNAAGGFRSVEILDYLLLHGGNANDHAGKDEKLSYFYSNETPLTEAAFTSLEKTKMLIVAGADVNFAVEPGMTPVYKAAHRLNVLEYLLKNCKVDYKRTYIVTMDTGDTLFLKELVKNDRVAYQQDSVRVKRILKYIDEHFPEARN